MKANAGLCVAPRAGIGGAVIIWRVIHIISHSRRQVTCLLSFWRFLKRAAKETSQRVNVNHATIKLAACQLALEKKIAHGGHPVLRWMADNIFIRTDSAGKSRRARRSP